MHHNFFDFRTSKWPFELVFFLPVSNGTVIFQLYDVMSAPRYKISTFFLVDTGRYFVFPIYCLEGLKIIS